MTETARTAVYAGAAWVFFLCAWISSSASGTAPELFSDQGQPFFPGFTDFTQATSLEVWKPGKQPFKVEFKDGVWRLPSKFGYPADAKDRLGKIAAKVMGLERTVLRSDREQDQAELGVKDPQEPGDGAGTRVTVRDKDGNVLADLILGKEIEGADEKLRYARVPSEKRTYATKADLDLSTQFNDWIDTDLLGLDVASIASITIDKYEVDETLLRQSGAIRVLPGEKIVVGRTSPDAWTLGDLQPGEAVNVAAVTSLTDTLKELKIADVLKRDRARLEQVGFFVTRDGQVYSNQGEVRVDLDGGVQLVLRFGEIAGSDDGDGLRRFVVINAAFNPTAMKDDTPEKRKAAKEKVREHNLRFADWYYVITAEGFEGLRPTRAAMVKKAGAEEDAEDDGAPPFPPAPGD